MPKQDPIDYVNHLRLELDSRNPRTRLAVFGTLIEGGAPADENTLAIAKEFADWAGEGVDELLADYLRDALANIPEEEEEDTPGPNTGRGGTYL